MTPQRLDFDGLTFDRERDGERLGSQLYRVLYLMLTHRWFHLNELAQLTAASEASVSARLRDLRKPKFGGYTVERRYVRQGLWEYRIPPNGDGR